MTASISAFLGAIPAVVVWDRISPTHWRLMPRECLRLQGFDEWQIDRILAIQSDAQAYKQAGNSVTANVIEAIGRRIREVDAELKAGAAA